MSFLNELKNINFKSQKHQNKERTQSMLFGVLLGTAIGTVAGIFVQTDKGKQVRKDAVVKAKDAAEKSKVVLYDSVNKIKATKDKVIEKVKKNGESEEEYEEEVNVMENN